MNPARAAAARDGRSAAFYCLNRAYDLLRSFDQYQGRRFEDTAQPEAFSSVFRGLRWVVVTLTTVGYGDVYPITSGGKIFTFYFLQLQASSAMIL